MFWTVETLLISYQKRPLLKSAFAVSANLPVWPSTPPHPAMPFTLSRTSMSSPATGPHSLPVFFSPSAVLHDTTAPFVTTIFGGSAIAAAVGVAAAAAVALAIGMAVFAAALPGG